MNPRAIRTILSVLTLTAASAPSLADATSDARAQIQSQYDRLNATVLRKDVNRVAAFYTPDYIFVDLHGVKHPLSELQTLLKQILPRATEIHGKTAVTSVKLVGGRAVVRASDASGFTLELPGQPPRKAAMGSESTAEDVWVKGPGGWRWQRTRQLTEKRLLNGKPMVIAAPAPASRRRHKP